MGLVLTRKVGETIILKDKNNPDEILAEIKFSSLDGIQIKLRIEAPKHIDIVRDDVTCRLEATETQTHTRR